MRSIFGSVIHIIIVRMMIHTFLTHLSPSPEKLLGENIDHNLILVYKKKAFNMNWPHFKGVILMLLYSKNTPGIRTHLMLTFPSITFLKIIAKAG